MLTQYQIKGVPQSIILKGYKYSYKEYLSSNDLFKYRCINRSCKCFIKISKEMISKIQNKKIEKMKKFNIIFLTIIIITKEMK